MNTHLDALLNLPWVTVETCSTQEQAIDLRLEVLKDTCECPHCSQTSREVNQVRYRTVRDLSIAGRASYLEIPSRQFYCQGCQKYFTENLGFVEPRRAYTQRYEEDIYQRVQQSSLTQVGCEEGLTFDAVEGIFKHQCSKKKELKPAKKLSIDEFSHRKGRGKFATVVSDIEAGELVEVMDTHEQDAIIETLSKLPLEWRQAVEEVSVDMWGGFPKVIQEVFPNAQVVIDRFHVMKAVMEDLDRVRRQSKKPKQKIKG
ncbi:MAG: ISL3 family transposase, partial [Spirulinaceae cyanobacterium SM2_1_0]|nr:ISL3 family transposase [Spirulinaceae cyanobacterium SM2_1_0]